MYDFTLYVFISNDNKGHILAYLNIQDSIFSDYQDWFELFPVNLTNYN